MHGSASAVTSSQATTTPPDPEETHPDEVLVLVAHPLASAVPRPAVLRSMTTQRRSAKVSVLAGSASAALAGRERIFPLVLHRAAWVSPQPRSRTGTTRPDS